MHFFTLNPQLALRQAFDNGDEEATIHDSEGQLLDVDSTALPGALEVYLIRATDIVQVGDASALTSHVDGLHGDRSYFVYISLLSSWSKLPPSLL